MEDKKKQNTEDQANDAMNHRNMAAVVHVILGFISRDRVWLRDSEIEPHRNCGIAR